MIPAATHDGGRTISRLAAEAGVKIATVRFYERQGLLTQPPSPAEGWRRYGDDAVTTIRFIKRAQALGFTLAEIRGLLDQEHSGTHCDEVRRTLEAKILEVQSRIRELQSAECCLQSVVTRCQAGKDPTCCPLLEDLSAHAAASPKPARRTRRPKSI